MSGRRQVDLCNSGKKATVNDPSQRSVNRNATAGSANDIYKHNPWRGSSSLSVRSGCLSVAPLKTLFLYPSTAPGTAPVADVCGLAGGTPWGPNSPEAGDYVNTTYAHHGTVGSTLGPLPNYTPPSWTIGGQAMVTWQVSFAREVAWGTVCVTSK